MPRQTTVMYVKTKARIATKVEVSREMPMEGDPNDDDANDDGGGGDARYRCSQRALKVHSQ